LAAAPLAFAPVACAAPRVGSLEITTHAGIAEGTCDGAMPSWKGVPFAAPPVDELRRRDPRLVVKRQGVRISRQFAASRPRRAPRRG
jgi:para-nitrobenzyl esterase